MRAHALIKARSWGILAVALLVTSTAHAEVEAYASCEREPTESDISAAKGAYEAGEVSFQEADYERAILYWEDAFRRDCTAVKLLLNLARAYELSGDHPRAVRALRTYVERRPDAKDRSSVEKRIAKLEETIAEKQSEAQPAPPVTDDAEPDADEAPANVAEQTASDEAAPPRRPLWPIFVTGGGVVVALLGHGLYQVGEQEREDKAGELGCDLTTEECPTNALSEEVNVTGQDKRNAGASVAVVGHLAGISGGVLWWILWTRAKHDRPSADLARMVTPIVSPNYQGLSISGRF